MAFSLSSVATLANVEEPWLHHNCDAQLALCLINAGRMSEIEAALGAAAGSRCGRAYATCRKEGYWTNASPLGSRGERKSVG